MSTVRSQDPVLYNAEARNLKKEIQELLARTQEMVRSAVGYADVLEPGDTGSLRRLLESIRDNAEETQKLLTALKKGPQP